MTKEPFEYEKLLTPHQVALMFSVDEKSVSRWAKRGLLPAGAVVFTPGGHRRFRESAMRALLEAGAK